MNTENIEYESLQDLELLQLLRRAAETSRRPEEPNRFPFGGPHGGEEGRGPHGPHGKRGAAPTAEKRGAVITAPTARSTGRPTGSGSGC